MKPSVTILIPFLNEKENIKILVHSLNDFFSKNKPYIPEVLFIDDGSTDNSVSILTGLEHSYSYKVIRLSKNFGSHAALRAGVYYADTDFITFIYADLQDPLKLVDKMFEQIIKGKDIVWGVRQNTNNPVVEKVFSGIYAALMRRFVHEKYPRQGFDVVMFNKKIQENINKYPENNSSIFLQILTFGFRQGYIEYFKENRKRGKSKWSIGKKIKLFIDSFAAFSYFPIRIVSVLGILFFITGILWTIYIILRQLFYQDLIPGWPALISIILIGFGITNISLGVIAEYLWRTFDASRNAPVFVIDEIIDKGNRPD